MLKPTFIKHDPVNVPVTEHLLPNKAVSVLCINPFSPSFLKKFYLSARTINNVTQNFEDAAWMTEEKAIDVLKNPKYKRMGILRIVYL
jgi:hypothetical protein